MARMEDPEERDRFDTELRAPLPGLRPSQSAEQARRAAELAAFTDADAALGGAE